jgi:pantoate--beta-alanine ligase
MRRQKGRKSVKNPTEDLSAMLMLETSKEMRTLSGSWRGSGQEIGFVPTMGALHEGHLSLFRRAQEESDRVVASIFVNPTQFGANEDFDTYPRRLRRDRERLEEVGCDALFVPSVEAMYGTGSPDVESGERPLVEVGRIGHLWEGLERPGHFRGVATIVAMLFHAVLPHRAYFGEKDYQQLKVVQNMARSLLFGIEIVGCPTVRESGGLAMSSRNAYLSEEEREAAIKLYQALNAAAELARKGARDARVLARKMHDICDTEPLVELQYAAVVDAETLTPLERLGERPARAIAAAHVGTTHLIDNVELLSP